MSPKCRKLIGTWNPTESPEKSRNVSIAFHAATSGHTTPRCAIPCHATQCVVRFDAMNCRANWVLNLFEIFVHSIRAEHIFSVRVSISFVLMVVICFISCMFCWCLVASFWCVCKFVRFAWRTFLDKMWE